MNFSEALIGRGLKYPIESNIQGSLVLSEYIDRLNQSIHIILDTRIGSKIMQPDFGSRIQELRFEPLDDILMERIDHIIREDLFKWEPRIEVLNITFSDNEFLRDNGILLVTIHYKIINTDISTNYVYPFKMEPRKLTG